MLHETNKSFLVLFFKKELFFLRSPSWPKTVAALIAPVFCTHADAQQLQTAPPSDDAARLITDIPGARIVYYDVSGDDARAVRVSMNAVRPKDMHDGKPVDALTRWYVAWHWPLGPDGDCDLARVTVSFRATVLLPRLVGPGTQDAALAPAWHRYMTALMTHEAGHVRHAYEHTGDVAAALRQSRCATANKAGADMIRALAQYDIDYDAATHHGATQGARFP